ncbi:MAG: tRNA 2-thiouridine(34) synthase MnmA [Deltaproteobacteria bacterium]|nr:tRNA 2-thiouridine(34) synthase MnmA [Deltaproteobacteria bacterium]
MTNKKRIIVAMSGGVDSSVAALLLREQGHDIAGMTMSLGLSNRDEYNGMKRGSAEEIEDARRVCRTLGIDHYVMDCALALEDKVIQPFISEYLRGRTPNPCVECNRSIKFDLLLNKALSLGFDAIATGHYARIAQESPHYFLRTPKDQKKDQTYFLYVLNPSALPRIVFPLADYTKDEVRQKAKAAGLPVSEKTDSQDVCFIPQKRLDLFLEKRSITVKTGPIIHRTGRRLGYHQGIAHYTVGQRTGLGISWPVPLYVLEIDAEDNELIVGEKEDLKAEGLKADCVNLLVDCLPSRAVVKIRYAHQGVKSHVSLKDGELCVRFDVPQEAVAPGQSAVLYEEKTILGGGIIKEVLVGYQGKN